MSRRYGRNQRRAAREALAKAQEARMNDQRLFRPRRMLERHNPPHSYGDCWRTCLAMALDLPQLEVPHFGDHRAFPGKASDARQAEQAWLAGLGYGRVILPLFGNWGWDWVAEVLAQQPADAVIVVTGKSPRGNWNHDVVWRKGQLLDPFTGEPGHLDGPAIDAVVSEAQWYWACIITPLLPDAAAINAPRCPMCGEGAHESRFGAPCYGCVPASPAIYHSEVNKDRTASEDKPA